MDRQAFKHRDRSAARLFQRQVCLHSHSPPLT